jgi:hypothetical protein
MWIVGKLRGHRFEPLADSPTHEDSGEAEAWARTYLETYPGTIQSVGEYLTWRRLESVAADAS